jgi:small nuclear ribonucleoprotein (snRNP)-like protein
MVRRVEGQCVGAVLVLAKGAIFEQSIHLENYCANNQAKFDDSLLVV